MKRRHLKTIAVLLVSILLSVLPISSAFAEDEKSTDLSPWAEEEVYKAIEYKLVTNNLKENFQQNITREEFCELSVKLYEALSKSTLPTYIDKPFIDTTNSDVIKAYKLGIINGAGNNNFNPNNPITRQEISILIYNTITKFDSSLIKLKKGNSNFEDFNTTAAWAREQLAAMNDAGIIKGIGTKLFPLGYCTREQAIIMMKRAYEQFGLNRAQGLANLSAEYPFNDSFEYIRDVIYGNEKFFMTTSNRDSKTYRIYTSIDGKQWEVAKEGNDIFPTSFEFVNNQFINITPTEQWTSKDGVNWEHRSTSVTGTYSYSKLGENYIKEITYAKGKYIAVGDIRVKSNSSKGWETIQELPLIYTSNDGITWSMANLEKLNKFSVENDIWEGLDGIIYANDKFIAYSGDHLYSSKDGVTWTSSTIPFRWIGDLTFHNGIFAALVKDKNYDEMIATSKDGVKWSVNDPNDSVSYSAISSSNGIFILTGNHGEVFTSKDGANWTSYNIGTDRPLYALVYGNNILLGRLDLLLFSKQENRQGLFRGEFK